MGINGRTRAAAYWRCGSRLNVHNWNCHIRRRSSIRASARASWIVCDNWAGASRRILHYRCTQNPYQNSQIFYSIFSSARFWVLNLHNLKLSEVSMMSIGMDRQLVLPIGCSPAAEGLGSLGFGRPYHVMELASANLLLKSGMVASSIYPSFAAISNATRRLSREISAIRAPVPAALPTC